jgi:Putative Ig domain
MTKRDDDCMKRFLTAKTDGLEAILLIAVTLVFMGSCTQWLPASAKSLFSARIDSAATLPTALLHRNYHYELNAEGGTAPYHWALTRGHLPLGLTLEENGQISGQAEVPGDYSLDVAMRDGGQNPTETSKTFMLRVAWSGLAVITSNPELPWGRIGTEYSARLTAGGDLPPFFWTANAALPPGITLTPKGVLQGSPTRGGDFQFEAQVTNLGGGKAKRSFSMHISTSRVDRFGGVITPAEKTQATGRWRTAKYGDRWVFITPEGHPFWMNGMWDVTGDEHKDERGATYDQRGKGKYGNEAVRWLQANRRLRSWGFNAIGPYSYRMMLPFDSEPEWTGSEQPLKLPFVWIAHDPAITGRKEGVFKNLYAGVDLHNSALEDQGSANFPDVFDPAWVRNTQAVIANDHELASIAQSPYLIGVFGDDTDYVSGFGPGPEFATQPPHKTHVHLGYLALITAPARGSNEELKVKYSDPQVYTKSRLRDFLREKYGSIEALDAAWGAGYSTLDSDGGWPNGKGLLDENGRASHKWLGSGDPALPRSSGANPTMVRDLDEFLYLIARQLFSTEHEAFRKVAPHSLFFGPTTIGGWWAPAREPIYRAARESLDVIGVTTDGSQEQVDFITRASGDTPLIVWEGVVANGDSSQWRHAKEPEGARWFMNTQAARGEHYRQDVERLFDARSSAGVHPFVGHLWWAWTDSIPEERNWGVVSLMDNAYDGYEASQGHGIDAWGYTTGGEEHNYGDFLTPARAINFSVIERLSNEQH